MKKTIIGALAGLAMLGTALPAAAASAASVAGPTSTTVSKHRHCSAYPGSVYTTTKLDIRKHRVHQGERNRAVVRVRSAGQRDPRGTVTLVIRPDRSITRELHNGIARFDVPRHLSVGRHAVVARYRPKPCSRWARSSSNVEYITVVRHHRR